MSSAQRKKEIARLRQEGADAYHAGKSIHSNPYGSPYSPNAYQWRQGYEMEIPFIPDD